MHAPQKRKAIQVRRGGTQTEIVNGNAILQLKSIEQSNEACTRLEMLRPSPKNAAKYEREENEDYNNYEMMILLNCFTALLSY